MGGASSILIKLTNKPGRPAVEESSKGHKIFCSEKNYVIVFFVYLPVLFCFAM